jgi:hypothetical protein
MSDCPEQWNLDVNDRYQAAVGVVSSLSTASMVLPIFFLKDIVNFVSGGSILDALNCWAFIGWGLLAISVMSAIVYYYSSAKWVKLSWKKSTDMFGIAVVASFVERVLDLSFFLMMAGFVSGLVCMLIFMITVHPVLG